MLQLPNQRWFNMGTNHGLTPNPALRGKERRGEEAFWSPASPFSCAPEAGFS